jgi:hypothetical protein
VAVGCRRLDHALGQHCRRPREFRASPLALLSLSGQARDANRKAAVYFFQAEHSELRLTGNKLDTRIPASDHWFVPTWRGS